MPRIPPEQITQFKPEKRTTQIARGMKQGVIKATVEQVLEQISVPIAEKLIPQLHKIHPNMEMADPAIRSVIDFALLNALAEVLEYGGSALSKAPGVKMSKEEAQEKCKALALWIRNYSGERFGESIVETAAQLVPLFTEMLSNTDLTELLNAVDDEIVEETVTEQFEVDAPQPAFVGLSGYETEGGL